MAREDDAQEGVAMVTPPAAQQQEEAEGTAGSESAASAAGAAAAASSTTTTTSTSSAADASPPSAPNASSSMSSPSPGAAGASEATAGEASSEGAGHVNVPLVRQSSSMFSDPASEVGVGDEVYMEGDAYSDMLFTYGVKTVVDAQGRRVPVETALGGKLVGVLFTSANGSDPVAKGVAFTNQLEALAAANKDTFAVLYVSQDLSEPEMMGFLSKHPSFFALAFEDKNTGETLKESLGASDFFFPSLMVLDTTGMCVSTWGRSAVMWNPNYCLLDWKNGREGVTTSQLILHRFFK